MTTMTQPGIRPQQRTIDGLTIRFAESGRRPGRPQALLLSPWPESLYAFEPTWDRLTASADLLAVDLPGFGRSEYRESLMSPSAMGRFLLTIADAFELERPHVVAPDIGTNASLFAAAAAPERFESIVVGSGGAAYPLQLDGVLKEWVEAPDLAPYRAIDGRHIVDIAIGTLENYVPSPAARADYQASYAGERFAESMRYVQAYPTDLARLGELLAGVRTPVQIIAGQRDSVVPIANAEYLQRKLPHAALAVLDAGHFTWEDAANEYAAIVTRFWDGEYLRLLS